MSRKPRKEAPRDSNPPRGARTVVSEPVPASPDPNLLDFEQAASLLKTSRPTFYRWLRTGRIRGLKVGRQWRFERSEVERFLKGEEPRIELRADISPLLGMLERQAGQYRAKPSSLPEEGAVERTVSLAVRLAMAMRASDIHIAAKDQATAAIRFRIDGVLHPVAEFDARLLPPLIEKWKSLAGCNALEKARSQDGRISLRYGDTRVDMRAHFLAAASGEALTTRLLLQSGIPGLDLADFPASDRERLLKAIGAPNGLIVVTGPTGCGKTTTLYVCLATVNSPAIKVMTIEDPVEMTLPWAVQIPLNREAGSTFPGAIRSCLRSDADVIMVGEIRDQATAQVAMQAALTGHLVLTTIHVGEAAAAFGRLVEIGCPPFLVADTTILASSQRLIRKICPRCGRPVSPAPAALAKAERLAREGGLGWEALRKKWRGAAGCVECRNIGYLGRTVIVESIATGPEIGQAVRSGAPPAEIRAIAVGRGMTTMAADGIRRAADGVTTLEEALRVQPLE